MKNIIKGLFIAVAVIFLGIIGVKILFLPAWSPQNNFSLSSTANIATSISGIFSPVLGLVSIILLYLTLSRQADSIKEQKIQNNSDAIVASIELCQKAVDDFSFRYTQGEREKKTHYNHKGTEGIFTFINMFCYEKATLYREPGAITYGEIPEANQISWILATYEIGLERIKVAQIPSEIKEIFEKAISAFYDTQLSYLVSSISTMLHLYPHLLDNKARKVQAFYKMMENKEWDEEAKIGILE